MQVNKAVITAAGGGQAISSGRPCAKVHVAPGGPDGLSKPVLQVIAEEAIESGIEKICVVCGPGDEEFYRKHFRSLA